MSNYSSMSNFIRPVEFRVEMTAKCQDSADLPKCENAGAVENYGDERVQIMHNGLRVICGGYHGDWMVDIISSLKGHHEPQEERLFFEVLKYLPIGGVILELGGFWSYYSLWFCKDRGGRAIVVEPDPQNITVGKRNASLNQASIDFIPGFIGDSYNQNVMFQSETSGVICINQYSVESILERFNVPEVSILHCDIQGGEKYIVKELPALVKKKSIKFLFLSTHSHHITGDPLTHQRCLSALQEMGAFILAEYDVHESFSGDGLIVAYFGEDKLPSMQGLISLNRYSQSLFANPLVELAHAWGIPGL
jgi:FkbM family methyltransferase